MLGPHGALVQTANSHRPGVRLTKLPVRVHTLPLTALWTQMPRKLINQKNPFGKVGPQGGLDLFSQEP